MTRWAIDIDRDDITAATLVAEPDAPLPPGAVELRIDRFAMTANNVTYAALGKPMGLLGPDAGYWDFFAERDAPGRLPVWGFAAVTRSAVDGVAVGDRLYGYYPLASHVVLYPDRVRPEGFVDANPRRAALPPIYNQYQQVEMLDGYVESDRDWWPIYRPLYLTGWLIADQLAEHEDYGAAQVIVASASSKTAMSFAHAMGAREPRPRLVALTSRGSMDFVTGTGLYDEVRGYEDIAALDADTPAAFVDMAGSGAVTQAVHARFGEALRLSLVVGKAHWDARQAPSLAGPQPTGFFAPAWMAKRAGDWGGDALRAKVSAAWTAFMARARSLTTLDPRHGPDAALAAYREAVAGKADPRAGIVIVAD